MSTALVWKANTELKEAVYRERREAYFQRITVAHRELSIDNLAAALRALEECPEDLRGWEWYYLMRLCKVDPLVIPATTEVRGVAFSPTGDRLASAGGDGTVMVWNSTTGKMIQSFAAHADSVLGVAFHPNGKHVASVGADRQVKVWDLTATDLPVLAERCGATRKVGSSYTVAFSPDGRQLAVGTDGVKVWDARSGELVRSLRGHTGIVTSVAFGPDDRRLISGSRDRTVKVWDLSKPGEEPNR